MSLNLTLNAIVQATLHLKDGTQIQKELDEPFPLRLTPTVVTNRILGSADRYAAYRAWVLETFTSGTSTIWDEGVDVQLDCQDGTMVLVGPTVRTVTVGERHLYELDQWLVEHAGWEIEWGGL
jgi:hypothetical protein